MLASIVQISESNSETLKFTKKEEKELTAEALAKETPIVVLMEAKRAVVY